jgi:cupin superfamily acireductone dioxygenase involved in methionine salvage
MSCPAPDFHKLINTDVEILMRLQYLLRCSAQDLLALPHFLEHRLDVTVASRKFFDE